MKHVNATALVVSMSFIFTSMGNLQALVLIQNKREKTEIQKFHFWLALGINVQENAFSLSQNASELGCSKKQDMLQQCSQWGCRIDMLGADQDFFLGSILSCWLVLDHFNNGILEGTVNFS